MANFYISCIFYSQFVHKLFLKFESAFIICKILIYPVIFFKIHWIYPLFPQICYTLSYEKTKYFYRNSKQNTHNYTILYSGYVYHYQLCELFYFSKLLKAQSDSGCGNESFPFIRHYEQQHGWCLPAGTFLPVKLRHRRLYCQQPESECQPCN